MGLQARCIGILNESIRSEGNAHCGDGEVDFRGDTRLRWKFTELSSVESHEGRLILRRGEDQFVLELGDVAAKWADAILNPKSRLDKLGVKPGQSVALIGEFEEEFMAELQARAAVIGDEPHDIVFVLVVAKQDLPALLEARAKIKAAGMIWAVWAKGKPELRDSDIREFALANGLVDVKVVSFSSVLSGLKLVIPVKLR